MIRKNKVSFDLYEYAENTTNHIWEPEVFYTIRYSREGGLETIPALGKRAKPIHHLTSSRAQLGEEHVQKIVKAFERVHPGNGLREMLYDKRREKCSLDIKVIIQYFYYLGKYPQLEQLVKAGYGAVIRDILQFSPQVVNKRINAVFHLVTAAKGAEEFYTTANNSARTETVEEAAELDDKLISTWTGHPHLRVIDNTSSFEDKMKKLVAEIASFLGEPEPYEIERKYLIEYPDIKWLESNPSCQRIEIIQTYLNSAAGEEVRVRQRGVDGNYIYFQTIKRKVSDVKRVEIERRLSQAEYLKLLMEAERPSDRSARQDIALHMRINILKLMCIRSGLIRLLLKSS